jgi:REP element-mobilizing transposase RayT
VARRPRLEVPGGFHHLTTRGAGKQDVFKDYRDRSSFLELLQQAVARQRWCCHAYVLMGNHYHLLVETPLPNLGEGMRSLNGDYARQFNRRHSWTGHLFGERFKSKAVEGENYLLEVARYIVLNPVRAGLCRWPWEWPWSSFAATAGSAEVPPFLTVDLIRSHFGTDKPGDAYRAFVLDGLDSGPLF